MSDSSIIPIPRNDSPHPGVRAFAMSHAGTLSRGRFGKLSISPFPTSSLPFLMSPDKDAAARMGYLYLDNWTTLSFLKSRWDIYLTRTGNYAASMNPSYRNGVIAEGGGRFWLKYAGVLTPLLFTPDEQKF